MIFVEFFNHVDCKIITEKALYEEISSYFTFKIPDFELLRKRNPKWRYWDGKIKLFNKRKRTLPFGLLKELYDFCKDRNYKLELDKKIINAKGNLTKEKYDQWLEGLKLTYSPRDYQYDQVFTAIKRKRATIISPTGSGKSFTISLFIRWCYENVKGKILLIVPTTSLIKQLKKEYKELGLEGEIHEIMAGKEKESSCKIYFSTWQSLHPLSTEREFIDIDFEDGSNSKFSSESMFDVNENRKMKAKTLKEGQKYPFFSSRIKKITKRKREIDYEYFKQFDAVVLDEAHSLRSHKEAESVIGIIEKLVNAEYRMGCTATLREGAINKFQLTGMFGDVHNATTTKKLMDRGILSPLKIRNLLIQYPSSVTEQLNQLEWDNQQLFIESNENPRQQLICEMANKFEKNTLILFRKISHGEHIYETLSKMGTKQIEYIDGTVDPEERERIRQWAEDNNGVILVASFGVYSVGVNIKNLHNVIFASSYKSWIKIMQSLGRSLRKHKDKDFAIVYDVADDIGYMKKHNDSRNELYSRENFDVKEKIIKLEDWANKKEIVFF